MDGCNIPNDGSIATVSTCLGYLVNHPTFWDVCFELDANETKDIIHNDTLDSGLDIEYDENDNFNPGRRIYAIRNILSARSLVFRAMFRSGMWESNIKNKSTPIYIPDVTPKAFLTILQYIYTGNFKLDITAVFQVLYAAKKYDLQPVITECIHFIKSNVNKDNVLDMLKSAYLVNVVELVNFAEIYAQECTNIINSKSFLDLPENILKIVIVKCVCFSNEIDILFSVIRWAEHQLAFGDLNEEVKQPPVTEKWTRRTGIEMIPKLQKHKEIMEQVSRELMEYCTKPTNKIISLRKILKSVILLIRFPLITRKDILTIVFQTKILTKDQLNEILIYKSFQECPNAFVKLPIISFAIAERAVTKIFRWKSDFDENGVVFWIGSSYGHNTFQNPMINNLGIIVKSSHRIKGNVTNIVNRKAEKLWTRGVGTTQSSFISIDIGKNNHLIPTGYTLQHGYRDKKDSLRNWIFEGSNDDKNYYILSIHQNDQSLNAGWATKTFSVVRPTNNKLKKMLDMLSNNIYKVGQKPIYQIPGYNEWLNRNPKDLLTDQNKFRYFRIRLTGPNSGGCGKEWRSSLTICSIELYGILFTIY